MPPNVPQVGMRTCGCGRLGGGGPGLEDGMGSQGGEAPRGEGTED